ncbi:MAG: hypothetical protein NDI80_01735 [Flavobacteriaceae bacterium]|nr:hypothetical protein [Flavobacteriaceae bacterium]
MKPATYHYLLFILACLYFQNTAYSQNGTIENNRPNLVAYPKGIYQSYENFKSGIPTDTLTQFVKKTGNDTISHRFYNGLTNTRLKKEFAFSDGTHLYLNLNQIIKNFEKEDKGQLKDDGSYHIKALTIGARYIYFEDYFTSTEAAVLGGLMAASIARRVKGFVYDREKQQFNLFKNAQDFEKFIRENHPEYLSKVEMASSVAGSKNRKKQLEDINLIREIIHTINTIH